MSDHLVQEAPVEAPKDSWKLLHEDRKISLPQTCKKNPQLKCLAFIITLHEKNTTKFYL